MSLTFTLHPAESPSALLTKRTAVAVERLMQMKYYAHIIMVFFLIFFALLYTVQTFAFETTPLFAFGLCALVIFTPFYIPFIIQPNYRAMRIYSILLTPMEFIFLPAGAIFSLLMIICVVANIVPMQKEFWIFHSIAFGFMCIPGGLSSVCGFTFFFMHRISRAMERNSSTKQIVELCADAVLSFLMNMSSALRLFGVMVLFTANMVYAGDVTVFCGFILLMVLGVITLWIGYAYQNERRKDSPSSSLIVWYHATFLVLETVCCAVLTGVTVYTFAYSALLYTVFGGVIGMVLVMFYLGSGALLILISGVSLGIVLLVVIPKMRNESLSYEDGDVTEGSTESR